MSQVAPSRSPLLILACIVASVAACGSSGHPGDAADARPSADAQAEAAPDSGAAGGAAGQGPGPDAASADHATLDVGPDGVTDAPAEVTSDAGLDAVAVDTGPPLPSGSPWRALAITTGIVHACALLDNHQIKCWGPNAYGCLGTGDPDDRGNVAARMGNGLPFVDLGVGRTATAIAAGRYTTCAILDTGAVKCWGISNFTGEPASAKTADGMIGNAPGELGDTLPPLDLGPGRKAIQIASGYNSTCVVLDDGSARCWGGGAPVMPQALESQVGVVQLAPANGQVVAVFKDGSISAPMPNGGPALTLGAGQKATYVGGSETGTCAVLTDGHLVCTDNLPPPATTSDIAAVDVEVGATCVLARAGEVRCWGGDCGAYAVGTKYWCPNKPLADGSFTVPLGQPATAIGTSAIDFSCALLADGGVKCWTTYDQCTNSAGGGEPCAVPPQLTPIVGGAVAITGTGAGRKFGAWGEIDLGTRP